MCSVISRLTGIDPLLMSGAFTANGRFQQEQLFLCHYRAVNPSRHLRFNKVLQLVIERILQIVPVLNKHLYKGRYYLVGMCDV